MFQNPYLYPNYMPNIPFQMSRGIAGNALNGLARNTRMGLFGRLANSFGFIRNINWSNLINNTSKTLGVINQTIPLVKQAGPMVRNVKSVLKLASVFKDETDPQKKEFNKEKSTIKSTNKETISNTTNKSKENNYTTSNQPTFFIN